MQKKIIALAIAAAFSAPAFADTTVYGVADAAVANISADGQKSDLLAVSGGLAASRLGVNNSEDLGNGMKVLVNLEYGLDIETQQNGGTAAAPASNIVARQQLLGVAGGFGTVATGYLQTTGFDFGMSFDPTADSAVSPLGNVTNGGGFLIGAVAGAARAQRALAYISPDMGGLTIAVNHSTALAGAGNLGVASGANTGLKTTATLLSANYKAGALAAGAVYAATNNDSINTPNTSEWAIGASYDLKLAKLFATYQSQATSGVDNHTAMSVSAVAPVGPGAVALSYAKNTMGGATNTDASGMTVAWLQGLSKTATFYAAYSRMSQGADTSSYSVVNNAVGGGNMTLGGGSSIIAAGLSKKF